MYCGLTDITIWIFSIYQYIIKKALCLPYLSTTSIFKGNVTISRFAKIFLAKIMIFLSLSFLRNKKFLNRLMFIPFSDVQLHCKTRRVTHLISSDSSFDLTHLCFNVAKEMHTLQN